MNEVKPVIDIDLLNAIEERNGKMKRRLREAGYYIRMTEWHEGFQCCVFNKTDFRDCFVSEWNTYETQAWEDCLMWFLNKEKNDANK